MKKLVIVAFALGIVFSGLPAYAESETAHARYELTSGSGRKDFWYRGADSDNYFVKAPSQLFRGIHNVAFGWAEMIYHPIRNSQNAPLLVGTLTGLVTGPVMAVTRTLSGAADVLTFWIPGFHGWPMSQPVLGLSR